jgi:hypothetical protein
MATYSIPESELSQIYEFAIELGRSSGAIVSYSLLYNHRIASLAVFCISKFIRYVYFVG